MRVFIGLLALFYGQSAFAGMPSFSLTEIASFRLSSLSFFLLLYLVACFGIYKLWNLLAKDFKRLPHLPFSRAMLFVFIWGLCFHLVLVMIAGTRELMTPKVWEKAGAVSKLSPDVQQQLFDSRRHKLVLLKQGLWDYATRHDGQFPARDEASMDAELWLSADGKHAFEYVGNLDWSIPSRPLAYEPESYGQQRMVLLTSGHIELLPARNLERFVDGGQE